MTRDLLTIREYEFGNGIKIIAKIDRIDKTVSLVEDGPNGTFPDKKWYFTGRTVEYAKSWIAIFAAMRQVTEDAIEELEPAEKTESDHFVGLVAAVQDTATKRKINELDEIDRAV